MKYGNYELGLLNRAPYYSDGTVRTLWHTGNDADLARLSGAERLRAPCSSDYGHVCQHVGRLGSRLDSAANNYAYGGAGGNSSAPWGGQIGDSNGAARATWWSTMHTAGRRIRRR